MIKVQSFFFANQLLVKILNSVHWTIKSMTQSKSSNLILDKPFRNLRNLK